MRIRDVSFATWIQTHAHKDRIERWIRELYPWPVLSQVECHQDVIGLPQEIVYDEATYHATVKSILWQPQHGTFKYRVFLESDGLGWHSRSFSDEFDLCATQDGTFVTLFHRKKDEPLEKIARAFFARRWDALKAESLQSLAVSRFLSASIVGEVAEQAFDTSRLTHYPTATLLTGTAPMLACGHELWIGYRFFSEHAYAWARSVAWNASRVVALYFSDTTHQFKTALPPGAEVQSIAQLDAVALGGRFRDLILALQRGLQIPATPPSPRELAPIVLGHVQFPFTPITEADVHESLAALKRPCHSKDEFRYQLAAGVLLNAWIESESTLGFARRKKFYAFKQHVNALARWAVETQPAGVVLWSDVLSDVSGPVLYARVDDVDFSFHALPVARDLLNSNDIRPRWSGVRLKPIAPLVLAWARSLL